MSFTTKDGGSRQTFNSGMLKESDPTKARFDLLVPRGVPYNEQFLTRCAALLSRGAQKYAPRNWESADNLDELEAFQAAAGRHFQQWMAGETDEDHAAAVFFNLMAYETTLYKIKERNAHDD